MEGKWTIFAYFSLSTTGWWCAVEVSSLLPIFHLQMSALNSMPSDPIRGGQNLPWEARPISSWYRLLGTAQHANYFPVPEMEGIMRLHLGLEAYIKWKRPKAVWYMRLFGCSRQGVKCDPHTVRESRFTFPETLPDNLRHPQTHRRQTKPSSCNLARSTSSGMWSGNSG